MELDFEKEIRNIVKIRLQKEKYEDEQNNRNGEYEYTMFKCWCWAFNNGKGQNDAKVFAKYLKSEKKELSFNAKKHLAEKYFGYEYELDTEKYEWVIKKKRS